MFDLAALNAPLPWTCRVWGNDTTIHDARGFLIAKVYSDVGSYLFEERPAMKVAEAIVERMNDAEAK